MSNGDGAALGGYHERTKHSPASVRAGAHQLDWDNQPMPFKVYPELEAIALPSDLPGSERFALDAIRGPREGASALDLPRLAHLLYFAAGVLRHRSYPGGEIHFRAAACTGALYHIDAYVACAELPGLPAGLYHFGPHDFALHRLRDGDQRGAVVDATASEPHAAHAPVLLVLTSTFWRNAWKYRTRTYRHCFWDAGTLLANLLAAANAVGVPVHVLLGFVDAAVSRLLDLDPSREVPLAVIALGAPAEPPRATTAEPPPLGLATLPLSREEIVYPMLGEAHAASALAAPADVRAWRDVRPPQAVLPSFTIPFVPRPATSVAEPIEAVIMRRGSTRRFPRREIPLDALATIVDAAARPIPLDAHAPSRCYLIANAVAGLDAGAYVVSSDGAGLSLIRRGDFRREAGFLGLGQDLPADAAACLYWIADLEPVFARFGDRGYRVAQLEAAIAGGRTYLVAYALGLGATGLTFFDDDVIRFFSPDAAGGSVMFHMAVGTRAHRPA
jgi:SagB-type dehydrogenase family enzyme